MVKEINLSDAQVLKLVKKLRQFSVENWKVVASDTFSINCFGFEVCIEYVNETRTEPVTDHTRDQNSTENVSYDCARLFLDGINVYCVTQRDGFPQNSAADAIKTLHKAVNKYLAEANQQKMRKAQARLAKKINEVGGIDRILSGIK